MSQTLKISPEKLNANEALDRYGVDSLVIMKLIRQLEKEFGDLPKTLFFEYQTLAALAEYFIENHSEVLQTKISLSVAASVSISPPVQEIPHLTAYRFKPSLSEQTVKIDHEDIAIIGLSGQYPEARDIDVFWENLKAGKDCIKEIPTETDGMWHAYYDQNKNKPGKAYSRWG